MRKGKRKKELKDSRRVRVNMRLPPELLDWAKEYAKARHTTLTQVTVDLLVDLQAENAA